jgi:hypothetical protein
MKSFSPQATGELANWRTGELAFLRFFYSQLINLISVFTRRSPHSRDSFNLGVAHGHGVYRPCRRAMGLVGFAGLGLPEA